MPAKPKKNGRQNHDWGAMKAEYVADPESSLRKIAEKYGVSLTAVGKKSKADNWFATKQEHQEKVLNDSLTEVGLKHTEALTKELESVLKISNVISEVLESDPLQFNRHLTQIETPEIMEKGKVSRVGVHKHVEEKLFKKLDTRSIKDIAQSLKMIESMKRSMLEIQSINERQRYEIELARLELEKERLSLEKERNALRSQNIGFDNESVYGVVLIPEVMTDEESAEDNVSGS